MGDSVEKQQHGEVPIGVETTQDFIARMGGGVLSLGEIQEISPGDPRLPRFGERIGED
jgi:hypothetical protein